MRAGYASFTYFYENTGSSEFVIGQLTLKFEGVTNEGIGEPLRILTARILEEVRKAVNRRG